MRPFLLSILFFTQGVFVSFAKSIDTSAIRFQANLLLERSQNAFSISRIDSAISLAHKAEIAFTRVNDMAGICEAMNAQGKLLTTINKIDQAVSVLEKSLRISRAQLPQPHPHTAQSLNNLGYCYGALGEGKKALSVLEEALQVRKTMFGENHPDVARSYFILSHHFGGRGNYEKEGIYLEKVLEVHLALNDSMSMDLKDAYNNLGVSYSRQGNFAAAMECYEKVLEIMLANALPVDHFGFAVVYNNMGNLYQQMGASNKALLYIRKAHALNVKYQPGSKNVAVNLANIGNLYMGIGELEQARTVLEEAVALDRKVAGKDVSGLAMSLLKLGECLVLLGEYEPALKVLKEGEGLLSKQNPHMEFYLGANKIQQSKALFLLRDRKESAKKFQAGVELMIKEKGGKFPSVSEAYHMYAKLLFQVAEYEAALEYAQQGLVSLLPEFRPDDSRALPGKGTVYSWRMIRKLSLIKGQALRALAETKEEAAPLLELAWANLDLALQMTDSMRIHFSDVASRQHLGAQTFPGYALGMDICHALYEETSYPRWVEEALAVAEKSKAFLLSLALRALKARQVGIVPESLLARERFLKTALAKYDERLQRGVKDEQVRQLWDSTRFALELQSGALRLQLEKEYPELYRQERAWKTISVAELQADLEPGEVVLEYLASNAAFFLLEIRDKQVDFHRIERSKALDAHLGALRRTLTQAPDPKQKREETMTQFAQPANAVYQALLAPALERPNPPSRLFIVPDGPLSDLPFEVLLVHPQSETATDYHSLPYLFRTAEIRYAFAARFLPSQRENAAGKGALLAMAPTFEGLQAEGVRVQPGDLPYTADEVRGIARQMGGTTFLGNSASEANFKKYAQDFDILHLASHFVRNDSSPMASGILFSGDTLGGEDGILHLYELFSLPLNAKLAVLSACNTGSGKLLRGEGPLSLAWGFRMAGCPALVVSLWNANDQATARLMTFFYEALEAGLPKDAALNLARYRYLESADNFRAHPYFWSQFVLLGDGTPLSSGSKSAWWMALLGGIGLLGAVWWWRGTARKRAKGA